MTGEGGQNSEDIARYVGDAFWLGQAATIIQESHAILTRQAERVSAAAAWFWTAYLAYLAFIQTKGERLHIFDAAPAVLLVLSYLCATLAQGPHAGRFDPRVPEQIRSNHNSSIRKRQVRLGYSYALLATSALCMCISFVVV